MTEKKYIITEGQLRQMANKFESLQTISNGVNIDCMFLPEAPDCSTCQFRCIDTGCKHRDTINSYVVEKQAPDLEAIKAEITKHIEDINKLHGTTDDHDARYEQRVLRHVLSLLEREGKK